MALSGFLSPKNDVAFCKIFGFQKHKDIIIIELPKFTTTQIEELNNFVEKCCCFFKYAGEASEADLESLRRGDKAD